MGLKNDSIRAENFIYMHSVAKFENSITASLRRRVALTFLISGGYQK